MKRLESRQYGIPLDGAYISVHNQIRVPGPLRHDSWMRVVSWNVNFPGARRAERLGAVLHDDSPDLVLLQEVNPRSAEVLRQAAGVDWIVRADEAAAPRPRARPPPHT